MERKTREKRKRKKKVEEISQDEKQKIREEEINIHHNPPFSALVMPYGQCKYLITIGKKMPLFPTHGQQN